MAEDPPQDPAPAEPARSSAPRSDRPRDAAALIVVDHSTGAPRTLLGRRRADLVFLPGKFVFPGGRVDRADYSAASVDELHPLETAKLMVEPRGETGENRPRALALAAVRETFEEAGLLIGARCAATRASQNDSWAAFQAHGIVPRLSGLTYFARAITPPGRPRRYDTRFFAVDASEITHRVDIPDGELSALDWFTLDDMRSLDLPGITRVVIEDLAEWLKVGLPRARSLPVPFYFHRNGSFERVMLTPGATPS